MFEAIGGDVMKLPATGSALVRAGGEWRESDTPGFLVKPLIEDDVAGIRTWLMKVEPGAVSAPHSHADEIEQIYMLEGHFSDGEASYGPGDFVIRAPGASHFTTCDDGALMLLTYSKPAGARA